jgi:hypothetical protein
MPDLRVRRMTLVDAMVLVAAAAVGFAVVQVVFKVLVGGSPWVPENLFVFSAQGWTAFDVVVRATDLLALILPIVAAWTVSVPVLRLRKPRRRWRQVASEPGTVACLAALAATIWSALASAFALALDFSLPRGQQAPTIDWFYWLRRWVINRVFVDIGLAVTITWMILAASGRWRRAGDWLDRLGRVLGIAWLIIGLVWYCRRCYGLN